MSKVIFFSVNMCHRFQQSMVWVIASCPQFSINSKNSNQIRRTSHKNFIVFHLSKMCTLRQYRLLIFFVLFNPQCSYLNVTVLVNVHGYIIKAVLNMSTGGTKPSTGLFLEIFPWSLKCTCKCSIHNTSVTIHLRIRNQAFYTVIIFGWTKRSHNAISPVLSVQTNYTSLVLTAGMTVAQYFLFLYTFYFSHIDFLRFLDTFMYNY